MRLAVLLSASCFLVAACGGGDAIPERALRDLVLQPSDLAAGFEQFQEGRQAQVEQPAGVPLDRNGRRGGWIARYRRRDAPDATGPLVVESRADVFAGAEGAARELELATREFARRGRRVDAGALGDEAVAFSLEQGGVRFFVVAWREANAAAVVSANGFVGKLTREDVLDLAQKQQRRLEDALD